MDYWKEEKEEKELRRGREDTTMVKQQRLPVGATQYTTAAEHSESAGER